MNQATKSCPVCRTELVLGHKSGLTTFRCPSDHGVAIDLVEAYSHLQRDELEAIWDGARLGKKSPLHSPVDGTPMVEVTFVADDDLTYNNTGGNARQMTIEVDVDNHIGWFSLDELLAMPVDRQTQAELVSLADLDAGDSASDGLFNSLSSDDFGAGSEPQSSWSSLFGGLARRLR